MNKTNPWIISTFVLAGLIVGFGIGQAVGPLGERQTAELAPKENRAAAPRPAPAPSAAAITLAPISDRDHIRGAKNPKITLVEFSDTECPFCKRFHPTMKKIVDTYQDDVAWVYRHLPLDELHSKARKEAEATECAAELGGQEKFWSYLDRLFEVTPANNGLDPAQLPAIAQEVGLNKAKFEECLQSGRHAQRVADDVADATQAGGQGTPYSVLITSDGKKYPISGALPYEQISGAIEQFLKGS